MPHRASVPMAEVSPSFVPEALPLTASFASSSVTARRPLLPPPAVTRHGSTVVARAGSRLPDACVRCGRAARAQPRRVGWTPAWTVGLVVFAALPFVLAVFLTRRRCDVAPPSARPTRAGVPGARG